MRKLIVAEFITLDGVIQAPGHPDEDKDGGFAYGGWTQPYWDEAIGAHFFQAMSEADTLLLGRKTWQGHGAAFDPMPDGDPFGDVMKAKKKYVVSTTLKSTELWRNSTIISKDVVNEVRNLKAQPGQNIVLDGSSVLVHTLIDNDLVDEFALHFYPLVLGTGKRLLPDGKRIELKLLESQALPSGVVYERYEPIAEK
jgi:dihydrofolate reductase